MSEKELSEYLNQIIIDGDVNKLEKLSAINDNLRYRVIERIIKVSYENNVNSCNMKKLNNFINKSKSKLTPSFLKKLDDFINKFFNQYDIILTD